jgi:flagellin
MRINHNIAAMIGHGAIYQSNVSLNKSLEKLSTGLRINRASDDAAGLSISENLRAQVRGLGMAKRNAQDGIALLQIAEGGANEMSAILQRMRELAVQSASDTLTSTERTYTNQEFDQLRSEITRIANSTTYNGQELLSGSTDAFGGDGSASCFLWVGSNANTTYDRIEINIDTLTTVSYGLNILANTLSSQGGAFTAIASLDNAIDVVNRERSDLGAYINRLEHTINNVMNQEHNTQAAESVIRDTDFALETAKFTKDSILTQSATAMLAQANMVSQGVMALLGR